MSESQGLSVVPGLHRRVAGLLLAVTAVLAVLAAFGWPIAALFGGVSAWVAMVLMLPVVMPMMRIMASGLLLSGAAAMLWALMEGNTPDWQAAIALNVPLIGLLIAATFLQLLVLPRVAGQQGEARRAASSGPGAFLRTGLAVHLFGAVINLSMVMVAADRLRTAAGLGRVQTVLVGRFFTAGLFWSPFFGAMAAALSFAPGATLASVLPAGLALSSIALIATWWGTGRHVDSEFRGYPVDFGNLWLPALLAVTVVTLHVRFPELSVLALITLLAPVVVIVVLLIRQPRSAPKLLVGHVVNRLPNMCNEILLFLSAAVMAAGLAAVVAGFDGWTPFDDFGATQAWLTLVAIVMLAGLGAHPVVGVALFGTLLAPMSPEPTLLAVTFLAGWAIASVGSPFSGLSLMLQGFYKVQPWQLIRWHWRYVIGMLLVCWPILWLISMISR